MSIHLQVWHLLLTFCVIFTHLCAFESYLQSRYVVNNNFFEGGGFGDRGRGGGGSGDADGRGSQRGWLVNCR
jgi:hypothetical protein